MFVRHVSLCKYYNATCCLATMGWFKVFFEGQWLEILVFNCDYYNYYVLEVCYVE